MSEKNFMIEKLDENNYVVRNSATGESVYQDISYRKCLEYISRYIDPSVSYFVINHFSSISRWAMTERQQNARKDQKWECAYFDSIKEALDKYKELCEATDFSDAVVNSQTGQAVPEVALGVCINKRDICDVLYASSINKSQINELCTDFIIYTKNDDRDEYRLGNLKGFIDDMEYLLSEVNVGRARYLGGKDGSDYHFGPVPEDFFNELPVLRTYENYGEIR